MRSNLGLERRGTIDPPWNWTTTKGRQRAVRRARTSFAGLNKKNFLVKSSKRSADTMEKDHGRPEDIFLSESEKVSVNILGRHFSDSLEIVPIKKRRFLLVDSSSSPLQSSYSDDSDHLPERQPTLFQESSAYGNNYDKRIIGDNITSLSDISEETADGACFSGISILAAAACSSEILSETIDAGGSLTKGRWCKNKISDDAQVVELQSFNEDKEQQFQSFQDVQHNCNVSIGKCSTFVSDNDERLQYPENGENVANSLQDISKKAKFSSCDSRLHWDLNIVMDAWNDEVVISNQLATDPVCENHNPNSELEDLKSLQYQVENKENKCPTEVGGGLENEAGFSKNDFAQVKSESQEKLDACNDNSISDYEKAKQCCTLPAGQDLVEQNLGTTSVCLVRSTEETEVTVNQESHTCCAEVVASGVRDIVGFSSDTNSATESVDEAKADMDSGLLLETETSISQLPYGPVSDNNSHLILAPSISKLISDEPPNIVLSSTENSSEDHCLSNTGARSPFQLSSSQIEEHGLLKNSGSCDMPPVCVEKAPDDWFDGDVYSNSMDKCRQSGGSVSDDIDIINGLHTNESSRVADITPCPLNNPEHTVLSSNPDVLPSGMTCIEQGRTELKADSKRCVDPVAPIFVSVGMSEAESKVNLDAAAMSTHETVNDSSKVVANGLLNHDSSAHQVGAIQTNELENIGLIGDDDSQFEDGEFRESALQCWGEDGANEGESERVDYECENRENAILEVVSNFKDSASSAIENITCKSMDALGSVHDGANAVMSSPFSVSQPSLCLSRSTSSEAGHRKRTFVDVGAKDCADRFTANVRNRKQCNDTSEPGSHSEKMVGYGGVTNGCRNNMEPSANVGMKSSGWDQVPVGHMHSGDSMLDTGTAKQDGPPGALNVPGDNETLERSSTPFRRGLSSRIERLMSLDESHRKARSYSRVSRSDDHGGLNMKTDRDTGAPKSAGRGRSSQHIPWRGREEQWLDSSNRHGPRHHDSPGYCDAPSYARSGSRNATAAAVAKVESNGFVVAADGTIVRADGAGSSAHVVRRTVNSSSQNRWGLRTTTKHGRGMERRLGNARDMSPDKHYTIGRNQSGKYGHEMARDQYCRPVPDNSIGVSLSVHRLSRRDRSFSPHRGPQRLSKSHSRSPSRTRSPHRWTSPRRSETGINDVSVFRRYSRSPKAVKERMRSPHSRPNFEDHIVGYGPSSRSLASSMHSSRWFDERRDSPNHHREHEYKHCSRRSPSLKVFRNQRLDSLDSQGRLKPETYYHPLHSSKDPEVSGFSREYRCAGSDDRREYGDRYESLRPMRQYNVDNNDKRFR